MKIMSSTAADIISITHFDGITSKWDSGACQPWHNIMLIINCVWFLLLVLNYRPLCLVIKSNVRSENSLERVFLTPGHPGHGHVLYSYSFGIKMVQEITQRPQV